MDQEPLLYKVKESDPVSFFSMWLSSCGFFLLLLFKYSCLHFPPVPSFNNTIYWRYCLYPILYSCFLCHRLIDHIDTGLFLDSLFCFNGLCTCFQEPSSGEPSVQLRPLSPQEELLQLRYPSALLTTTYWYVTCHSESSHLLPVSTGLLLYILNYRNSVQLVFRWFSMMTTQ